MAEIKVWWAFPNPKSFHPKSKMVLVPKRLQVPLLAMTFGGVFLVLAKVVLYPTTPQQTTPSFVFPEAVPLPGWQLRKSAPLAKPNGAPPKELELEKMVSGRRYQYQHSQDRQLLDIEMRYFLGTRGDVSKFLQYYASIPLLPVERNREGVGSYGLLVYQQRAYLSACINPQVNLNRLVSWLLSQDSLGDSRCYWALLSVPLKGSSLGNAYQTLETAWFSWYRWWQSGGI